MAMHLEVESEEVPLVASADARYAQHESASRHTGVAWRSLAIAAAAMGLVVLGFAAVQMSQKVGGHAKRKAPEEHLLSAVAQVNLTETSQLWGNGPGNCMQCQQSGGTCCVDRPIVCCNQQQFCNLGRCAPLPARRPMPAGPPGARPMYGGGQPMAGGGQPMYGGGQPGYGYGQQPSLLQRMGNWLNPFKSSQPNPMFGSGGNGNGYGGGNGGPTLAQRLGGSMLGNLFR